jgi:hypothetical protein
LGGSSSSSSAGSFALRQPRRVSDRCPLLVPLAFGDFFLLATSSFRRQAQKVINWICGGFGGFMCRPLCPLASGGDDDGS